MLHIKGGRSSDHDGCDSRPREDHGGYHDVATKGPAQEEDPECVASKHLEIFLLRESAIQVGATQSIRTDRSPVITIRTVLRGKVAQVHTR